MKPLKVLSGIKYGSTITGFWMRRRRKYVFEDSHDIPKRALAIKVIGDLNPKISEANGEEVIGRPPAFQCNSWPEKYSPLVWKR